MRAALLVVSAAVAAAGTLITSSTAAVPRAGRLTGGVTAYAVKAGESLRAIGARFGVDVPTLAADNGLSASARVTAGQTLRVDNRHIVPERLEAGPVVVNVPQRMLFVIAGGEPVGIPVAVGRPDWPTPVARFTILATEANPTWDVPPSIQEEARRAGRALPAKVPPGPNNPLGRFWLGLSLPGVGIHGTNAPASIYGVVTHGCIRVHPDDIEWLFHRVAAGDAGQTIYEPVLLAVTESEIYLEVHRDVYGRARQGALAEVEMVAQGLGVADWIEWDRVAQVVAAREGIARPVTKAGYATPSLEDGGS